MFGSRVVAISMEKNESETKSEAKGNHLEPKAYQQWAKGWPRCINKSIRFQEHVSGTRVESKVVPQNLKMKVLSPLGRFLITFRRPLDFEAVPKPTKIAENIYRIIKKGVHEGVLKKHDFWMDVRCQNGWPSEAKTSISHYTCCKLRGFAGSWSFIINWAKKDLNHRESEPRVPRGWNFMIWKGFRKRPFIVYFGAAKSQFQTWKNPNVWCICWARRAGTP